MTKEEMIEEARAYFNHACFAIDCLTAYESIDKLQDRRESLVNDCNGFFLIAKYSISKCLLLELAKLYRNSAKEKTIHKLINIVKANNHLFPKNLPITQVTETLENEVVKNAESISKLAVRRDKDLSHNDQEYFNGKRNPALENYLPPEECMTLAKLVADYCNEILYRLEGNTIIYPTLGSDDLLNLAESFD